ncbi:MAG: hypothetical protein AAGI54_06930 [Planctomycetota bacterium]
MGFVIAVVVGIGTGVLLGVSLELSTLVTAATSIIAGGVGFVCYLVVLTVAGR